jgi:hypothetical protein
MKLDIWNYKRLMKSMDTHECVHDGGANKDAGFVFEKQAGSPRSPRQRPGESGYPLQNQTLLKDEKNPASVDETSAAAAAETNSDCGDDGSDSFELDIEVEGSLCSLTSLENDN